MTVLTVNGYCQNFGSAKIGQQTWMTENLNESTFSNGDPIPETNTPDTWKKACENEQPAWCYYNNDPANGSKFGKLYNWYAVNDPRGIAPKGWHVPTDAEWKKLSDFLGGEEVAGGKMKSKSGWEKVDGKSGNGSNSSGFTALPSGNCDFRAGFAGMGKYGYWWRIDEKGVYGAWGRFLFYNGNRINPFGYAKQMGMSVRCIKD